MAENICQYTKTCPIYQGTQEIKISNLTIHKNVFCKRGFKGWNNCEQYSVFRKLEAEEKKEND